MCVSKDSKTKANHQLLHGTQLPFIVLKIALHVTYASFPFLSSFFPPLASFLGAFFFPPFSAAAASGFLTGMVVLVDFK
jgi:hypothetical protein